MGWGGKGAGDREHCREAYIPEEVIYRPQWRITLDLQTRTLGNKVKLRWITTDEPYRRVMKFRDCVTALELLYVMEIPSDLVGWTRMPEIELIINGN